MIGPIADIFSKFLILLLFLVLHVLGFRVLLEQFYNVRDIHYFYFDAIHTIIKLGDNFPQRRFPCQMMMLRTRAKITIMLIMVR